jgi:hypothetical protein
MRWWDGRQWTSYTAPAHPHLTPAAPGVDAAKRKAWPWVAAVLGVLLLALVGIGAVASDKDRVDAVRAGAASSTTVDPVVKALGDSAVAVCRNSGFSDNTDFSATCSGGDGVDRWLAPYGECVDGTVIAVSEDATCKDHGGF